MAKTYAQIQAQIRKLQQEADALKAKEVAGVVARIQAAIQHYGLTAQDLFGSTRPPAGRKAVAKRPKAGKAARAARPPAPAKYQDSAGHQWSGIGKRPNWFKAALAAGQSAEALRIQHHRVD